MRFVANLRGFETLGHGGILPRCIKEFVANLRGFETFKFIRIKPLWALWFVANLRGFETSWEEQVKKKFSSRL